MPEFGFESFINLLAGGSKRRKEQIRESDPEGFTVNIQNHGKGSESRILIRFSRRPFTEQQIFEIPLKSSLKLKENIWRAPTSSN